MARLSVGDRMPNFTFDTAYENAKTVESSLKGKKRTVFWVLRYIGCTVCRYDVHVIFTRYREFLDLDAQVFVVMQSEPKNVREELKDAKLPFDIICDTGMEIYEALEIRAAATKEDMRPADPEGIAKMEGKRNKAKESGFVHGKYEGNEQQLPAIFIVERDGTVSYAHYAKNIIDMPTVDEMLDILGKMK